MTFDQLLILSTFGAVFAMVGLIALVLLSTLTYLTARSLYRGLTALARRYEAAEDDVAAHPADTLTPAGHPKD